MSKLKHLFLPGKIGRMKLKNRIVMSPMAMPFKPLFIDGQFNPRLVEVLETRARGGVGLMIISAAYTEEVARASTHNCLGIWDDRFIPILAKLVEALHSHGAKVGLHLVHGGSYARSTLTGTRPVSASDSFSNWLSGETPREATKREIKEIVIHFAKAVKRAEKAGFDLVEYNAYSGYLIREFLSPLTNKRTDEYGGGLKNRLRLFEEIIGASRESVGHHYNLIAKISGDEYLPGGNGLREAIEIGKALEKASIDGLHVSPAGHQTSIPLNLGLTPRGAFLYLARAVKEQVKIPVITAHVGDVFLADRAIGDGKADFIAFGRTLLADPELPIKAMEGRFEDIRPCIRCVQGCYDRILLEEPITCLMNPGLGHEEEYKIKPAVKTKKVMVIGGGPGGMEAALIAAQRGHRVSLYEKSNGLGGQLKMIAAMPDKDEFGYAIDYFSTQLTKQGVEVKLDTEVTPELVEDENPDVVVVATGARPVRPDIPGVDRGNVCTPIDILEGNADVGKRVVIVGGGGVGCEIALHLAKLGAVDPETAVFLMGWKAMENENALELTMDGREVTILEMLPKVARDIGMARKGFLRRTLAMHRVRIVTEAKVTAITDKGVQFQYKDGKNQTIEADTVVCAVGMHPFDDIYKKLQGRTSKLYILGDAKKPRKALDAIHEAAGIAGEL